MFPPSSFRPLQRSCKRLELSLEAEQEPKREVFFLFFLS